MLTKLIPLVFVGIELFGPQQGRRVDLLDLLQFKLNTPDLDDSGYCFRGSMSPEELLLVLSALITEQYR